MSGAIPHQTGEAKARVPAGLLKLIPLAAGRKSLLWLTVGSALVAQGATVLTLGLGALLVGEAISQHGTESLSALYWATGVSVVLTAVARWWQSHVAHDLAFGLIEVLQVGIYDGLERAAPDGIGGKRTGELASVATADAELMEFFYAHTMADYVAAAVVPLGALCALAFVHPSLSVTLLPFLPLMASIPFWLARRAGDQGRASAREAGLLNAEVVEAIQGQRDLAIFGFAQRYLQRLAARTNAVGKLQRHYGWRAGLEQFSIDLLLALAIVATASVAILLHAEGSLPLASVPLAVVLAGAALGPVVEITQTARKLGDLQAGAERILTIFHQENRIRDDGGRRPSGSSAVAFHNVEFRYDNDQKPALNGASFEIGQHETVALVGRSGAGKTTCANLLMRFRDPAAGAITIGGVDLRSMPLADVRRLVTIVPQDVHLFNETVLDNIRLAHAGATDRMVEDAARMAQAHDFIMELPQGYATLCGERGARLSGGQRQRLAIARAILRDAPVLIMDEASSNLDAQNELALQRAMEKIRLRRTVLIIAHRPSTIRSADRIVVLDDGAVVETGTHEALLAKGGAYCRLVDP